MIQHNVVKNLTPSGAKGICEGCSMLTATVDEVDHTLFSQGTQCRPDFNCSSATRRFRPQLHWLPFRVSVRRIIRCCDRHRAPQGFPIPYDCDSTILWHVEPFMRIRCPGIGPSDTLHQMLSMMADGSPETEGAIDMHPCTHFVRNVADLTDWIAGAGIHVTGLDADDCRPGCARQKRWLHPSLTSRWEQFARGLCRNRVAPRL